MSKCRSHADHGPPAAAGTKTEGHESESKRGSRSRHRNGTVAVGTQALGIQGDSYTERYMRHRSVSSGRSVRSESL